MLKITESKLKTIIDIDLFISSEKDSFYGEIVVLFLETVYSEDLLIQLRTTIAQLLPKYERPKKIICLKEFQRTITGKIIRNSIE